MTSFRPSRGLIATPLAVLAASVVMILAAGSSDAPAATAPGATVAGLRPTIRQRALAPRIAELLEEAHFSRKKFDDALSAQVLDRYLEALDSQRNYFTAGDISGFNTQRDRFDDMIHTGRIDPGFDIFRLYQQRNRERMRFAIAALSTEPDWNLKETYDYDRAKAAWPRDNECLCGGLRPAHKLLFAREY